MVKKEQKGALLDRDVSWMYFNHRILQEAERENVPLLERLIFLGIYSNNLDEFFRVRVSSLRRLVECELDPRGERLKEAVSKRLKTINRLTKSYLDEFEECFQSVKQALTRERIHLINETELSPEQANYIKMVYRNDLNSSTYPLITTQHGSMVNDLTDSSIYLAVRLVRTAEEGAREDDDFALIELPTKEFGRFIVLPPSEGRTYIMFLDDVIRFCLPIIFAGLHYEAFEAYTFKFTRDAEIELDPGMSEGLIDKISRGLRERKKGEPVRFVYDKQMPKALLRHLRTRLRIDRYDLAEAGARYHNMKDLMDFPTCARAELRFKPQPPMAIPQFNLYDSTLEMIRQRDYLLHYPYHNFSNYVRVLREAALSPDVRSIKTTVYRLAKDSKVVKALICAAQHGKKVTVVVELLARFDESSNINWSKKMQDAGIRVIFGVEGLKVHCKLTHISSSKGDVVCISTGNFHEGNARIYTDTALLTAHPTLVEEVDRIFAYINQPYKSLNLRQMIVAPGQMRRRLTALIDREIGYAREGRAAYILCKINHITDPELIQKLYEASGAGVQMHFLVRGNCSLVTGVAGVSDTIHVRGIIDRYLEHARILIFGGGGQEQYYMGSADWMTRNIDHRVEAYVPIFDPLIQAELRRIVTYGLQDNVAARVVDGSGDNRLYTNNQPEFRSQEKLWQHYAHPEDTEAPSLIPYIESLC